VKQLSKIFYLLKKRWKKRLNLPNQDKNNNIEILVESVENQPKERLQQPKEQKP
jgi:hypothetical protein